MAPLSLKIILEEGAVTRTILFDSGMTVSQAHALVKEKLPTDDGKDYGLFLTSADDSLSGIWLEGSRCLDYYMLRDGDSLHYLDRLRTLRVRMLDGSVKTLQVDESKSLGDLMLLICSKVGIANHDEYGLCNEELEVGEEAKEKPATGTLTIKRKAQQKDKDAKMEQLSKKLKTDDNVEWLDQHKTLREMGVDPGETLLLKRRLFYSDRNVDARDPVQLNLLYLQARNAILDGRHPVTEDQAVEFAAIQCHIQYGDFQEDKHKPGLIENLNEYLPVQYSGSWGAEKKILKLHRKHHGLSQVDAKHLYTKTARDLPTYGVSFFVVKEKQKGKKKLVHRLLGINSESILRLDEVTKEVLQVWPLTQVRTYHAGKNDTFSLNFGDYSEKEYSVKTNDAHRIREILEGYIDIIRRRLASPYGASAPDSATIYHDHVQAGRGNVITHVTNTPSKIVETSFVGPTQIVDYEQGSQVSPQGTQIMTVQQVIITGKGSTQQHAVAGEVPMRSDMSLEFVKKLNQMNSNSVKVVTLLTDPTEESIKEARSTVDTMQGFMPDIIQGVKETAGKQTNEEARKKLLDELDELCDYLNALSGAAKRDHFNAEDVQDPARKIADLTTQMYFSLDPRTKRRSALVRRSRQSFIQDEKTDATLRRASFIAAAATAAGTVDDARKLLAQEYSGPQHSEQELVNVEASAVDKMGKLNAAVAQYLTAHSDPKNIDYSAAVTSMNTINELILDLAKDAQMLSSAKDAESKQELLSEVRALCDAARRVCSLKGIDDHEKIQEVANSYADVSGRLIYKFGRRNPRLNADKENEIIDLSKDVGDMTTLLLMKANELTSLSESQPGARDLDNAGVLCADAARDLLATAQLTAPSIHEPHCQSALTASAESLSSSAQRLAISWRPLVDQGGHKLGEELKTCTMELARALDRLRNAYANLGGDEVFPPAEGDGQIPQGQRLRFITSVSGARDAARAAEEELSKPPSGPKPTEHQAKDLEASISQRMAQVNAAVASLVQAKSDPQNQDYEMSELAMATVSELMPGVITDTKALSSTCKDEKARQAILADMKSWCQGIDGVCASVGQDGRQDLDESAQMFAKASQKLSFVFSPRANRAREQLLMELSNLAHERAMLMTEDSHKMADTMGGASGARLGQIGREVGEKARVLKTSVQLTAPAIHELRCQSILLSSVNSLSSSARTLAAETGQLQDDETGCRVLSQKLHQQRDQILRHGVELERNLEGIREGCRGVTDLDNQRLKFVTSASAAQDGITAAQELLNRPVEGTPLKDVEAKALQKKLSEEMARVNAAVCSLIQAKSDPQKPDYKTAEQAIATVTQLMPGIVKETRELIASSKDPKEQQVCADLAAWCHAISQVCASAGNDGDEALDDHAQKFANASNKLSFVFSPRKRPAKEQQILQLADSAYDKAKHMVEETQKTAATVGGPSGARLQEGGDNLTTAAVVLRNVAQLTAPTIHEQACQSALISSAENLSSSAKDLVYRASWLQDPQCRRLGEELVRYQETLERAVAGIKEACKADSVKIGPKPPVPTRKTTLVSSESHPADKSTSGKVATQTAASSSDAKRSSQDFLNQLRLEESQSKVPPPVADKEKAIAAKKAEEDRKLAEQKANHDKILVAIKAEQENLAAKKAEEEKYKQLQFVKSVEDADKCVHRAEEELKRVQSTKTPIPALNEEQSEAVQKQMEQKLAQVGAAAAILVSSNHPDAIDYARAKESTQTMAALMPQIVKDAALLSNSRNEKSRRLLLDEIMALCEATRRLCASANDDKQKLNEAAVAFGDKSARLLYIVGTDVDPGQEKEVISRAKAIGDSASRLAMGGAAVAMSAGSAHAQDICDAGSGCADAAGALVYTAKLVAPSIHHPECQSTLIAATNDLSSHLKTFTATWRPLSSDPQHAGCVRDLSSEAEVLEKLLKEFREDLAAGKMVKMREVEKVVVEDTALRRLATKILEDAAHRAESPGVAAEQRRAFAEYANKLADAIRMLDVTNSRCKKTPRDASRRKELENAVQNLQVTLLQSRPALGDRPQNNIVDLTDFVKEVSTDAERLMETANKTKVAHGRKALENVKEECHKINLSAFRLMNPTSQHPDHDPFDDILEVDQFGQDCDDRIQRIDSLIQGLEDKSGREMLQEKAVPLGESCNMLRFATKCALATAQSAALDETLEDLGDLERRIDKMLATSDKATRPGDGGRTGVDKPGLSSPSLAAARTRLVAATAGLTRGTARDLAPALAAYVTESRAGNPQERDKLKEHLHKILDSLKWLTLATGTRVATWQPVQCPEVTTLTQEIIQELEQPANGYASTEKPQVKVLNEADLNKLLLPGEGVKIEGDRKQIEQKLQQTASKLSSLTGTLLLSSSKPESLSRSAHTTAAAALQLADTARALKTDDPVENKRIEEAAQEMSFATYNLLKTSELVSQDPNNAGYRRRLLDACRLLNDSINKLARTTPSKDKLHQDCTELTRSLQTQQNLLQSGQPSCALPYSECVEALQSQHDVIQKLKSEEPMSRLEFCKALHYVSSAVCNSSEYAAHCAYLISISESHKEACTEGLADVARIQKLTSSAQESCCRIMRAGHVEQARDEESKLSRLIEDLKQVVKEAASRTKGDVKRELTECGFRIDSSGKTLQGVVGDKDATVDKINSTTMALLDDLGHLNAVVERPALVPKAGDVSAEVKTMSEDVLSHSKKLLTKTQALVKEVNSSEDEDPMTWTMFNTGRSRVLEASEGLLDSLRQNGQRAGLVELPRADVEEETDAPKKSYLQIQLDLANKWLQRKPYKPEIQATGEKAARNIIEFAEKMTEDLKGQEKEEMRHLISESEQLLTECCNTYDQEKASALMERLRELRKAIQRGVVSRVVEDFIEAEGPLQDLDVFADAERDEAKRKFLLEKKIAELLAKLGRVTRTARFVSDASSASPTVSQELSKCSQQTELLAPLLVKAAQERVNSPNDSSVVDNYEALLAQYAESMSRVRDLCDQTVDPMDFVQTAGETMERMREESSQHNDPQKCAFTSVAIQRLAKRVIHVGMSSSDARSDPELRQSLAEAQQRLSAATPGPDVRASRLPDWKDTTAEILRTTGEVESVLGGENIFKKQPEPDQPIYNAALNLHAAVREWSARDNEIVAAAKRMAVLMARLSDFMNTDKKRDLIATSKSIVSESHEVSRLAKKLAHECTDVRIRTNLLQVCERIPTISGQLKMLTTIKGSSLGHQGTAEDQEAMDTLVGNAQNLMMSVSEVVKAAAGASVQIASQRGRTRLRWVRKQYY